MLKTTRLLIIKAAKVKIHSPPLQVIKLFAFNANPFETIGSFRKPEARIRPAESFL